MYISDLDFDLEMHAYPGTTHLFHPLGEWRVALRTSETVVINFMRSSMNYEEIYLYSYNDGDYIDHFSKEFANGDSEQHQIKLKDTGFIRLKVKKLNSLSNYSINLNQNINNDLLILVVICSLLGSCIILLSCCIILFCYIKYAVNRKSKSRRTPTAEQLAKHHFIIRTLKNMKSGKYKDMEYRYEVDSGVICLEEFEPDSEVNGVNEGSHVFHYKCLNSWFRNIRCDKDLVCPHCTIVITDQSTPKEIENNNTAMLSSDIYDLVHLNPTIIRIVITNNIREPSIPEASLNED